MAGEEGDSMKMRHRKSETIGRIRLNLMDK